MPRITKRVVDALRTHERERVVWDYEIKGFEARASTPHLAQTVRFKLQATQTARVAITLRLNSPTPPNGVVAMSRWECLSFEAKIRNILDVEPRRENHYSADRSLRSTRLRFCC
ncbi:MAG: hypothetical protein F4Y62_05600 [Rhodospirillaceae bacterium]|nr:hypothetical protein [Rhodospirillaceae bacterium]